MEDVRRLRAEGREESCLFVVDSRKRDTAAWPSPSHYEVEFTSPFKNVFAVDVLDANVPRSEYLVESGRNELAFWVGSTTASAWRADLAAHARVARVQPGDYTGLAALVTALNAAIRLAALAAGDGIWPQARMLSTPGDLSGRVRLTCALPFVVFAGNSSLRHILGLGDPVVAPALGVPGWSPYSPEASDVFASRPWAELVADPQTPWLSGAAAPGATAYDLSPVGGATLLAGPGSALVQTFVAQSTGVPTAVALRGGSGPGLGNVALLAGNGAVLASGTVGSGGGALQGSGVLVAGSAYSLRVEPSAGAWTLQGSDSAAAAAGVAANGVNLAATVAVSEPHALDCPGVVNLTGERYVTVRCPEIEQHLYRDRAFEKHFAGLACVKLGGYGYQQQRYDFVSFPARRFHPIGKLSRLTIRLERPDGTPYDAHGCDHTLLLVVKYYMAAAGPAAFTDRHLNPSYDARYNPHHKYTE